MGIMLDKQRRGALREQHVQQRLLLTEALEILIRTHQRLKRSNSAGGKCGGSGLDKSRGGHAATADGRVCRGERGEEGEGDGAGRRRGKKEREEGEGVSKTKHVNGVKEDSWSDGQLA